MRNSIRRVVLSFSFAAAMLSAGAAAAAQCGDSRGGFQSMAGRLQTGGDQRRRLARCRRQRAWRPRPSIDQCWRMTMGKAGLQGNYAAFAARHITPGRIKRGKTMLLAYAEPLERIEQRYGVPGPILVAIWGLETDFGAGLGAISDLQRARDARLRLPSRDPLSRRAHRRADDRPARPLVARADARRLGGRARPDPVHAVGLLEIRRLRRTAGAAAI